MISSSASDLVSIPISASRVVQYVWRVRNRREKVEGRGIVREEEAIDDVIALTLMVSSILFSG